jgi:hypothetical protein
VKEIPHLTLLDVSEFSNVAMESSQGLVNKLNSLSIRYVGPYIAERLLSASSEASYAEVQKADHGVEQRNFRFALAAICIQTE